MNALSLVETTSPSGLLSGSLDAARRHAAVHGEELLGETLAAVAETRAAIERLPGLTCLDESMVECRHLQWPRVRHLNWPHLMPVVRFV